MVKLPSWTATTRILRFSSARSSAAAGPCVASNSAISVVRGTGRSGEVLGGQSLAFASFEYTVPIIETVRGAVFYDAGFVNDDSWDPAPNDIYSDFGLGLRIKLPISPVPLALDYAVPVTSPDDEADKGGQFNFYLNYEY